VPLFFVRRVIMHHFESITPEQRWKNELLDEIRENNRLMRELINALKPEEKIDRRRKEHKQYVVTDQMV
jgi:hypothetical protein